MAKLLGVISLILAIVLFPPAALAVISNNAVPGDATYPIKRFMENGIYAVASLTPTTKAWFAAARSDRRFQEVSALISQGKQAKATLNELVVQTDIAASQINKITDQKQKEQLLGQLSQSIEKYDQGLQQLSVQSSGKTTTAQPVIVPSQSPSTSPIQIEQLRPKTLPSSTPKLTPRATVVPGASTTPTPTVQPSPGPDRESKEAEDQKLKEIEEARRRLEEIRRRLEEESSRHQLDQAQPGEESSGRSDKKEEKSENRKDNKRND